MSLDWCKKQGMKLIEPNNNLAEEYFGLLSLLDTMPFVFLKSRHTEVIFNE